MGQTKGRELEDIGGLLQRRGLGQEGACAAGDGKRIPEDENREWDDWRSALRHVRHPCRGGCPRHRHRAGAAGNARRDGRAVGDPRSHPVGSD